MPSQYIKRILEAAVYDVAIESPIHAMPLLSKSLENDVLLKREDLQPVFSFKLRGAYNKLAKLNKRQRNRGIIAASAGNHAQGVAISAQKLGIQSTIVMPKTTPQIKVDAVKRFGSKVILHGAWFDESCLKARQIAAEEGSVMIHPYDDVDVIAGQGTIGMEILRQHTGPIHAMFIPVGGGGLIAGIASYVKYLRPEIKIIGVEAEDSACLKAAMKAKRRVTLPEVGIFADGVAVSKIGKEPFRVAKTCVDEVITASSDEICAAIKEVFDDTRSISEPAGALSIAGMKNYVRQKRIRKKNLIAINSGANVNFARLRYISERFEIGEQKEIILAVRNKDKPGVLKRFCKSLHTHDITEFNYRYEPNADAVIYARIRVTKRSDDKGKLFRNLREQSFTVTDLSDNELAKMHVGHMVGGHTSGVENEVLYRLEFPECQGALGNFLMLLEPNWNISLFHYRKTGGAYGYVFIGIQIPVEQRSRFEKRMAEAHYIYRLEENNPAFELFLS